MPAKPMSMDIGPFRVQTITMWLIPISCHLPFGGANGKRAIRVSVRAMSAMGPSRPSHLALKFSNVRCSPIATEMLQCREWRDVPWTDSCTAAN